MELNKLL